MSVIFLSGVGAVGKTAVIDAIKNLVPCTTLPSITRSVYAKYGFNKEQDYLTADESTKINLQQDIFFTYLSKTREVISSTKLAIIDRSPIDHWSYFVSKNESRVNSCLYGDMVYRNMSKQREVICQAFFEEVCQSRKVLYVKFPFPNPWNSKDLESSDGFRADTYRNNYEWDLILDRFLSKTVSKLTFTLPLIVLKNDGSETPEQRAKLILKQLL